MARDNNPFGDLMKMFEHLKMPGIDMAAIVEARRKDVEALVPTRLQTNQCRPWDGNRPR